MKYSEWAESFTIFARYDDGGDVAAEHDELWAGPESGEVTAEDNARLAELGWRPSEEGGFHRFV